jgi:hypothetical protein
VRDKGRETLVGICQTISKAPEGVQHDFERQRFTMLGDWRSHLGQAAVVVPKGASAAEQRTRGQRTARPKVEPKPDPKQGVDLQVRTAITYEIK